MKLGIDRVIGERKWISKLQGKRIAVLAHPASVTSKLEHSIDALMNLKKLDVVAAFGPQHGLRGEKQDNMIESDDFKDPVYGFPVYSLYGKVRRPTPEMMSSFDVVLVDLQDVGCRIYTFLTTLCYMMDACEKAQKTLWVLDRPNPAGRPIEGSVLDMSFESFVGAAPVPMRHGLTLGEAALWYKKINKYSLELEVVKMVGYDPDSKELGWGWPASQLAWVNPSPNMPRLSTARVYAGTVMLEGTTLSEGRGTTIPLEVFGAPKLDAGKILKEMVRFAPHDWLEGSRLRPTYFEPTFHKFKGELCQGLQIHVDEPFYKHKKFKPYRLVATFFKALRTLYPDYDLWRKPPYEYETEKLPIDLLSGSTLLRRWVDDPKAKAKDFQSVLETDEKAWLKTSREHWLY